MEGKKREIELNIKDLFAVFLRCWWVMLLVGAIVGAGLYLALYLTHTDEYTATASVYVMREALPGTILYLSCLDSYRISKDTELIKWGADFANIKADVLKLPTTRKVLGLVLKDIKDEDEISESDYTKLQKMLTTKSEEDEHLVYISVTENNPETAMMLADLVAEHTCEVINNFLFSNEQYVKMLDYAIEPQKPSNPISKLMILLVAVGSMLIVYLVSFVIFLADDKINDPDDVQNYLHVSTLGQIPNRRETGKRRKKYGEYYYAYQADGTKKKTESGKTEGEAK